MNLHITPRLTIGALKALGALKHPYPQSIRARVGGLDIEIHCEDRHSIEFRWRCDELEVKHIIALNFIFCDPGIHHYFICPVTGKNVRDLYIVGATIASAAGHGVNTRSKSYREGRKIQRTLDLLAGENGARRARGHNRVKALEFLEGLPAEIRGGPALNIAISLERSALKRSQRNDMRSTARDGVNSTERALERGEQLDWWESANAVDRARSVRPGSSVVSPSEGLVWNTIEETPALDIRTLMQRRGSSDVWGAPLIWAPGIDGENDSYFAVIDFRYPGRPYLLIEAYPHDLGARWSQTIELVRSPPSAPERWFMVCPVKGTRHEILYGRGGSFASRAAQRLRYASQV